jgi:hypothetical protein
MKTIWFKRKRYGWGWYPSTWQGWITMLLFTIYIIILALCVMPLNPIIYFIGIILGVIILIGICFKFGEKPKWSWGN